MIEELVAIALRLVSVAWRCFGYKQLEELYSSFSRYFLVPLATSLLGFPLETTTTYHLILLHTNTMVNCCVATPFL